MRLAYLPGTYRFNMYMGRVSKITAANKKTLDPREIKSAVQKY